MKQSNYNWVLLQRGRKIILDYILKLLACHCCSTTHRTALCLFVIFSFISTVAMKYIWTSPQTHSSVNHMVWAGCDSVFHKMFPWQDKKESISWKNLVRGLTEEGLVLILHPTIRGQQSWSDVCSWSSCIYCAVNFCSVTSEYTSFIWLLFTGNLSGLADCCWCVAKNCCDVTHNKDAAILCLSLKLTF